MREKWQTSFAYNGLEIENITTTSSQSGQSMQNDRAHTQEKEIRYAQQR